MLNKLLSLLLPAKPSTPKEQTEMISGTDIKDYREDNPQQLWQLAEHRNKDKYIEMQGMVFKYGWLDGAYATVYDLQGNQYTLAAWTECYPLKEKPQFYDGGHEGS